VIIDNETYQIFNCLTLGEEDESKCKFRHENKMKLGLEHLEFNKKTYELLTFKSKLESCLTLFCNDKFKDAVKVFELTGLIFDENLIEIF